MKVELLFTKEEVAKVVTEYCSDNGLISVIGVTRPDVKDSTAVVEFDDCILTAEVLADALTEAIDVDLSRLKLASLEVLANGSVGLLYTQDGYTGELK